MITLHRSFKSNIENQLKWPSLPELYLSELNLLLLLLLL